MVKHDDQRIAIWQLVVTFQLFCACGSVRFVCSGDSGSLKIHSIVGDQRCVRHEEQTLQWIQQGICDLAICHMRVTKYTTQ